MSEITGAEVPCQHGRAAGFERRNIAYRGQVQDIPSLLHLVMAFLFLSSAVASAQGLASGFPKITGREVPCVDGKASVFECRGVDLVAYLPPGSLGLSSDSGWRSPINDMWGWIDSTTGREFALVGRVDGTAFVEVTDPVTPQYLGSLPLPAGTKPRLHHDIKVYKNHAFIVSESRGHGMQVLDLTQLRHTSNPPVTFRVTAHYDGFSTAHNIAINEQSGYAYAVGVNVSEFFTSGDVPASRTCGGGLHIIDIRDPKHPKHVTCYPQPKPVGRGYIHDTQCITYRGPDTAYHGREICLNAAANILGIVDVTDKQHPQAISSATYPNIQYAHQGWLSDDQSYFFLGDEGDEPNDPSGQGLTRTLIFDLKDLDDPVFLRAFQGPAQAIDHNQYSRDGYLYQANYAAGLRVIDVRNPGEPKEVGYFDTTPTHAGLTIRGAWSTYPYFKSGVVGVSSIGEGLFLLRFRPPAPGP